MTIINLDTVNAGISINGAESKQPHYLIFRRFNSNHYLADNTNELQDNITPADSLVCEINKPYNQVVLDKLNLHELPKKLPLYIIEGFRKRLEHDVKRSLYNEYNKMLDKTMISLFNIEEEIYLKKMFCDAKDELALTIKMLSKINDFFDFSIAIQKIGAMELYKVKINK